MPDLNRNGSFGARLMVAGLWLLSRLPYDSQLSIGRRFGGFVYRFAGDRREVTLGNLAVAFPTLSDEQREAIARESFRQRGMSIGETAHVWFRDRRGIADRFRFEGLEHLEQAQASGRGVILARCRFSCVDAVARELGSRWPIATVFAAVGSPFEKRFARSRREKHVARMIENDDMLGVVRSLLAGETVWYVPDQHLPIEKGGLATRFFGAPVYTGGGTARLARLGKAQVITFAPVREFRNGRWGYVVRFSAPLPLQDCDLIDATQRVNDVFERQIREYPEQYLWLNRRFARLSEAHREAPSDRSVIKGTDTASRAAIGSIPLTGSRSS